MVCLSHTQGLPSSWPLPNIEPSSRPSIPSPVQPLANILSSFQVSSSFYYDWLQPQWNLRQGLYLSRHQEQGCLNFDRHWTWHEQRSSSRRIQPRLGQQCSIESCQLQSFQVFQLAKLWKAVVALFSASWGRDSKPIQKSKENSTHCHSSSDLERTSWRQLTRASFVEMLGRNHSWYYPRSQKFLWYPTEMQQYGNLCNTSCTSALDQPLNVMSTYSSSSRPAPMNPSKEDKHCLQ